MFSFPGLSREVEVRSRASTSKQLLITLNKKLLDPFHHPLPSGVLSRESVRY